MIKRFNPHVYPTLSSIIDTIKAELLCPKFLQLTHKIEVYTLDSIHSIRDENREIIKRGFGGILFGSYEYRIVVNVENCSLANLSDREIAAVIYHELGHILNEPELEPEPTFEFCYSYQIEFNRQLLDDVKVANSTMREVFADSYANKHGYGSELISTFHKQNEHLGQQIEDYDL